MERFVEIEQAQDLPPSLTLGVGDVLKFWATGGRVESGADVVELFGPYLTGVIATNAEILSPMGGPSVVLFVARRPGRASVVVMTGDAWRAVLTRTLEIVVTP